LHAEGIPVNKKKIGPRLIALAFVAPAVILHLSIVALPSLSTLYYSFFEWNGLGVARFIGIDNYIELFTSDRIVFKAVRNNLTYLITFMIAANVFALFMSILLIRITRGQKFFRTFFFIPYVLSAVIIGRVWTAMYNPYFGMNILFDRLGFSFLTTIDWLGNPSIALFSVMLADLWHYWAFVMVLFLAALHQVDVELYEAAALDGCNKFQEFLHITLPGIKPTVAFIVMLTIIWSFLTYDYVWVMTMGGPAQSTELLSTWMYKNAFISFRAGYASAICMIQSFICIFVYLIFDFLKRRGLDA